MGMLDENKASSECARGSSDRIDRHAIVFEARYPPRLVRNMGSQAEDDLPAYSSTKKSALAELQPAATPPAVKDLTLVSRFNKLMAVHRLGLSAAHAAVACPPNRSLPDFDRLAFSPFVGEIYQETLQRAFLPLAVVCSSTTSKTLVN